MLRSYLKVALRGLIKNKTYSLINIFGLAVGMGVALLIGLWINYEYSYDRFLPNYEQLYQVNMTYVEDGEKQQQNAMSLALADVLRGQVAGIEYVAECDWMQRHGLKVGETKVYQSGARIGSDFLKMFQFPMLQGQAEQALLEPYSIVLTASTAEALFGLEDPMGQTVRYDNSYDLKVTGILEDLPDNSSFYFKYLVPFAFYEQNAAWVKASRTQWQNQSFQIFATLKPEVSYAQIEPNIRDIIKEHTPSLAAYEPKLMMHALKDWHLYNEFVDGEASGGYIVYVRMFGLIGLLVLLIACINFMNLATARSEKRAKEVGVRKAIGSKRKQLVTQFLTESFLMTFLASFLSILLIYLTLPAFNNLLDTTVILPFKTPLFWGVLLTYISITALLAGSYPALFLSSFKAVSVLKGSVKIGKSAGFMRKGLVLVQFSCSIALIIGTMVIFRQLQHVKDRPLGYDQNRLMMSRMSDDLKENYDLLKNDLLQSGVVESVAWASAPITDIYSFTNIDHWPGKQDDDLPTSMGYLKVTDDYFKTLGMSLVEGRGFYPNWQSDSNSVIINEAAVKRMSLQDPVGQTLTFQGGDKGVIVGIVNDALMTSPYSPAVPTFFRHGRWGATILYRLVAGVNTQEAVTRLTEIFSRYNPAFPYVYEFADDTYAQKFKLETLVGRLATLFAGLAIFVSCLGLFGLAAYMAEQRRKEIGIRKILGASLSQIWVLLSKEFLILVLLSCLIATPIAFYFLQGWLEQYSYRVNIGAGVFITAALVALIITIITISYQAIKAGLAQPVESLRVE